MTQDVQITRHLTPRWTPLRYHAVQRRLWKSKARIKLVIAGRRSGKTELAKRWLVLNLPIKKPWSDPRYFFAAPTRDQAKRIAWNDLKALIPAAWIRRIYESSLVITTIFGSELHVLGLDKPERMEGPPWDGGISDEICDLKLDVFEAVIYPALADRNGWCWRIGVPKRRGPAARSVKKDFDRVSKASSSEEEVFHWESETVLAPAFIRAARKRLDKKTYREQLQAHFETAGGLVYDCFSSDYNVRPCLYRPDKPIIVGSDFNVNPMAWCLCHRYAKPDRLEVFDELYLRDVNTPQTLSALHDRYGGHTGGFEFYGDATSRARKTSATRSDYQAILADKRFRRAGRSVHYPASNPAKADRYDAVNLMLCDGEDERRLFIDPRCVELIEDMEAVYYTPGTREASDADENRTHMADGLGYIVHYLYPIGRWLDESEDEPDESERIG